MKTMDDHEYYVYILANTFHRLVYGSDEWVDGPGEAA